MHHTQNSRSSFSFKAKKKQFLPCKMKATLYNTENYSINLWFQVLQLRQNLKFHNFNVTRQFRNISPYSFCDIKLWSPKKLSFTYVNFLCFSFQLGLLLPLFTLHQASSGDIICSQVFRRAHSSKKYDKGDNMFIILSKREYPHTKAVLERTKNNPFSSFGNYDWSKYKCRKNFRTMSPRMWI